LYKSQNLFVQKILVQRFLLKVVKVKNFLIFSIFLAYVEEKTFSLLYRENNKIKKNIMLFSFFLLISIFFAE
jgi:hypothetical protein